MGWYRHCPQVLKAIITPPSRFFGRCRSSSGAFAPPFQSCEFGATPEYPVQSERIRKPDGPPALTGAAMKNRAYGNLKPRSCQRPRRSPTL